MNIIKFFNTALGIWFLTSVIGGVFIWSFEKYIDDREHDRTLEEEYQLISLEYEGRLSQYSEWFMSQVSNGNARPDKYEFADCVTIEILRKSIKVLSGKPNFENSNKLIYKDGACEELPKFQSIFPQYSNTSTIGLLARFRVVSEKLHPTEWKIDKDDGALIPTTNIDENNLRDVVLEAINNFLNPDAVIPFKVKDINVYSVNEFRESVMKSFYHIGPAEFWYGDIFAG